MDHISSDGGQENALYADGVYDLSDTGLFRSVRFGIKLTDRRENDWTSPYNWRPLTPSYQNAWVEVDGAGNPQYDSSGNVIQCFAASPTCSSVTAASVNALKSAGSTKASYSTLVDTGTWFNGKAGLPAHVWFPSKTLLAQSFTTLHSYTNGLGAPGDQETAIAFTPDDLSRISERQEVFYGQLNFADTIGEIPFSGNVGVRVVSYKDTASGAFVNYYNSSEFTLQSPSAYLSCAPVGGVYPSACISHSPGYVANVINLTAPKTYVHVSGGHSQTDALPSLNIQFQPLPVSVPELKVRLAASQGVARPTFQQMNPSGAIGGSYVGTYESYFNGTRGNPDLKPEKADQFDASFEYYFDDGGLFHVAPFYKQIHNYIANEEVQVPQTFPAVIAGGRTDQGTLGCTDLTIGASCPQTVTVAMVEPLNETRTAFVRGVEIGLTKYATFLPGLWSGFGVDMNYTYINSQQPGVEAFDMKGNKINNLPAFGLSKNTVNLALMYDKHPISFRIAYNWRDSYLVSTAAYQTAGQYNYALNEASAAGIPQGQVVPFSLPVFAYPMGTLDANFTYSLTDDVDWTVEASNLTKTVARLFMGVGGHRENRSWYTADTRYTMQLRVKF
jgi:TonB-dependent receptor